MGDYQRDHDSIAILEPMRLRQPAGQLNLSAALFKSKSRLEAYAALRQRQARITDHGHPRRADIGGIGVAELFC